MVAIVCMFDGSHRNTLHRYLSESIWIRVIYIFRSGNKSWQYFSTHPHEHSVRFETTFFTKGDKIEWQFLKFFTEGKKFVGKKGDKVGEVYEKRGQSRLIFGNSHRGTKSIGFFTKGEILSNLTKKRFEVGRFSKTNILFHLHAEFWK